MRIKLWGVRGSIATPLGPEDYRHKLHGVLRHAVEAGLKDSSEESLDKFIADLPHDLRYIYGGNTTALTVSTEAMDAPVIVDCGTGIRALGDELMAGPCGKGQGVLRIFLTHTHWDHIQGLPFFKPLFIPGNEIHFYSPMEDLKSRLIRQQMDYFFPIAFEAMGATKHFHHLKETDAPTDLGDGLTVDFHPLKHPGGSFAYRFRRDKHTFIFATDAEFTGEDLASIGDYTDFFNEADLMILDAQYSLDEAFGKFDWGHTSNTMAVNCGVKWKLRNLVLTHHEPAYSDSKLFANFQHAVEHKNNMKAELPRLHLAREGMVFRLGRRP